MNDLLRQIEHLLVHATPGPWFRDGACPGPGECDDCADDRPHGAQDYIRSEASHLPIIECDAGVYGPSFYDAELIVLARNNMPELLRLARIGAEHETYLDGKKP